MTAKDTVIQNPIRSFVRRNSRLTPAQRTALEKNWARYELTNCSTFDELSRAFHSRAPVTLEIGSGDGACLLELAQRSPNENFLAVEVYRPGLGRLLHRAADSELLNIRVSDQDIWDLLPRGMEPLFEQILIFFPDPWPKKRHHKRRLLQEEFFDLIEPCLHRHGRVFIATDSISYAQSILETVAVLPRWINLAGEGRFSVRPKFRPTTKFENKAIVANSPIAEFVLARR
ncbi:MAG: tRNA (guanosine(46)-N7)-methyltransferase TrmB [Gammaproteobacteria bacterium]